MAGHDRGVTVLDRVNFVVEYLFITEAPVAEKHHKDGCPPQKSNSRVVQFVIIHWRLGMVIRN